MEAEAGEEGEEGEGADADTEDVARLRLEGSELGHRLERV